MKRLVFSSLALAVLTGCADLKKDGTAIDTTYRKRVKRFTLTEGVGLQGAWISQAWDYNTPDTKGLAK